MGSGAHLHDESHDLLFHGGHFDVNQCATSFATCTKIQWMIPSGLRNVNFGLVIIAVFKIIFEI